MKLADEAPPTLFSVATSSGQDALAKGKEAGQAAAALAQEKAKVAQEVAKKKANQLGGMVGGVFGKK